MRRQIEANRLLAGEFASICRHRAKPVNEGPQVPNGHGVHASKWVCVHAQPRMGMECMPQNGYACMRSPEWAWSACLKMGMACIRRSRMGMALESAGSGGSAEKEL